MRADWEREAIAAIEDAAMRVDGHVSTRAIEVILDAVEPFIRADERERIAAAIEAVPVLREPTAKILKEERRIALDLAARIARNGGQG